MKYFYIFILVIFILYLQNMFKIYLLIFENKYSNNLFAFNPPSPLSDFYTAYLNIKFPVSINCI